MKLKIKSVFLGSVALIFYSSQASAWWWGTFGETKGVVEEMIIYGYAPGTNPIDFYLDLPYGVGPSGISGPDIGEVGDVSSNDEGAEDKEACEALAQADFSFCESNAYKNQERSLIACSVPAGLSNFVGGKSTDICVERAQAALQSNLATCRGNRTLSLSQC